MEPMRQPLVARFAARFTVMTAVAATITMLGAAGAAFAGAVYVPVPDPVNSVTGSTHAVQIWITNGGTVSRPYTATYLTAESDGTQRSTTPPVQTPVAAGRTSVLGGVSTPGKNGLLEINTSATMSIEARLYSTPANAQVTTVSPLPVISSDNLFAAGSTAVLLGLRRDLTHGDFTDLGVVNLGQKAAQCQIDFFRADGTQIGATASLAFKPLSLRFFGDAFGLLSEQQTADARSQVSCDQPFYAYASIYTGVNQEMMIVAPAGSGASTLTAPGSGTPDPPPSTGGSILFSASGVFHTATPGNEKKTFNIVLPNALSLRKMVVDMDVVPGPWDRAKVPGNHAILWLYRGKFRGNTIANVNAFSPPKVTLKAAQNINLPAGSLTQEEQGVPWVQGRTYHLKYTYDAEHGSVTVVLSAGGTAVKTLQFAGTAPNGVLDVPATGLTAEFGHYADQEGPEVASYGWSYANLQIMGVPY
jgi:hypothetical protein